MEISIKFSNINVFLISIIPHHEAAGLSRTRKIINSEKALSGIVRKALFCPCQSISRSIRCKRDPTAPASRSMLPMRTNSLP